MWDVQEENRRTGFDNGERRAIVVGALEDLSHSGSYGLEMTTGSEGPVARAIRRPICRDGEMWVDDLRRGDVARAIRRPICRDRDHARAKGRACKVARAIRRPICRDMQAPWVTPSSTRLVARAIRRPICRDWSPEIREHSEEDVARAIRRPICRDRAFVTCLQILLNSRKGHPAPYLPGPPRRREVSTRPRSRKGHPAPYLPGHIYAGANVGDHGCRKGHPAPYLPGRAAHRLLPIRPGKVARAIRRPICRDSRALGREFTFACVARAIRRPICRDTASMVITASQVVVARAIRRPICRDDHYLGDLRHSTDLSQGPSGALSAGTLVQFFDLVIVVIVARAIRRPICRDTLTKAEHERRVVVARAIRRPICRDGLASVRKSQPKGHPAPYLPGPPKSTTCCFRGSCRKGHPAPYLPGQVGGQDRGN